MDIKAEVLDKAMSEIKWSLGKLGSKGLLRDSPETVFERITPEKDLSSAAEVGRVIEAAFEAVDLKLEIFKELDRLAAPETPLASNSSFIPPTRIAQATKHPERVLGLHFFGPVPLMRMVEVIKGEKTSPEAFEAGVAFVQSLGHTPIRVQKDIPGFALNRIFSAAFREAVNLVADGVATPEDIDAGMELGYGWNVGPFVIADNSGLDTQVLIGQTMVELGLEGFASRSDLIPQMVKEGRLGRKAGKGFYRYTEDGKRLPWGSGDQK